MARQRFGSCIPDDMIPAAREWLLDCFPDQEEEIAEAPADVIRREVERHYDGGAAQFVADAA